MLKDVECKAYVHTYKVTKSHVTAVKTGMGEGEKL